MYVNSAACELLGYAAHELINEPLEMLVTEESREFHVKLRKGFLTSARKRETGFHPPIVAVTKDGRFVELEIELMATSKSADIAIICESYEQGAVSDCPFQRNSRAA